MKEDDFDLSKLHDCEKCHGKIVGIGRDALGNTYCGYCGEQVDYSKFWKHIEGMMEKEGMR